MYLMPRPGEPEEVRDDPERDAGNVAHHHAEEEGGVVFSLLTSAFSLMDHNVSRPVPGNQKKSVMTPSATPAM